MCYERPAAADREKPIVRIHFTDVYEDMDLGLAASVQILQLSMQRLFNSNYYAPVALLMLSQTPR